MIAKLLKHPGHAIARFGYAGLIFFTVKGLSWIFLPVLFAWYLQ